MSTCLMVYDIPQRSGLLNPSNELWGYGFRLQYSGWVLMRSHMPYTLINELIDGGAKVDILDFSSSETGGMAKRAADSIRQEIRDSLASLEDSCDRYTVEMNQTQESVGKNVETHRKKVLTAVKKLRRKLHNLQNTAKRFNANPEAINIGDAEQRIQTLRCNMAEQARSYVAAIAALQAAGVNDGMESAAANHDVPPGILADYLEDKDIAPKTVKKLRLLTNGGAWFS